MDAKSTRWKLQDAKARFSELVRRARAGEPQEVTVHGKAAVVVVDLEHFEVHPKNAEPTLASFVEESKKYRGPAIKLRRVKMKLPSRYRSPFDENEA